MLLVPLLAGGCMLPLGMVPLEVGSTAPEFELRDTSGSTVSLSDFGGRSLLINFWSPT
jgi:peroxiredoxin